MTDSPFVSKIVLSPSNLTISSVPFKNDKNVLFPTPVSPITRIACEFYSSGGIASIPSRMNLFNLGKSIGFESVFISGKKVFTMILSKNIINPRTLKLIIIFSVLFTKNRIRYTKKAHYFFFHKFSPNKDIMKIFSKRI